jgi:hypothetical protein
MRTIASAATLAVAASAQEETLPPLVDGIAPKNFDELWVGFDPREEPLDVEVLQEWEKDGVVMRVVRFRVGIFKGKKSMLAGIYGFPKDAKNLPCLVQIHGGGQSASEKAVFTNAKRGYATLSLAWAGRIAAGPYTVNHEGVKLFHKGKTGNPNYRVTTDWGALDAYHDPCRNKETKFASSKPTPWTLDAVDARRRGRSTPWIRRATARGFSGLSGPGARCRFSSNNPKSIPRDSASTGTRWAVSKPWPSPAPTRA